MISVCTLGSFTSIKSLCIFNSVTTSATVTAIARPTSAQDIQECEVGLLAEGPRVLYEVVLEGQEEAESVTTVSTIAPRCPGSSLQPEDS